METRVAESSVDLFGGNGERSLDKFLAEFNLTEDDQNLNYATFCLICSALFQRDEIENSEWRIREIFGFFDLDKDQVLRGQEWKTFCDWLRATLVPARALLIVDVQNDFIRGSLALRSCGCYQDGADVIEPINRLAKAGQFDKVIYSLDWHPEDHISFYDNLHLRELHSNSKGPNAMVAGRWPLMALGSYAYLLQVTKEEAKPFDTVIFADPYVEQVLWPKHCVMGTWGAELHKDLVVVPGSEQVRKGQDPEIDAYSVFVSNKRTGSMELQSILRKSAVTDIYVCGLAYDVCVKATCLDGLRLGYALAVIDDCCRGVDASNIEATKKLISQNGGLVTNSDRVLSMVNDGERSLVMSHQRAKGMSSNSFVETSANGTG